MKHTGLLGEEAASCKASLTWQSASFLGHRHQSSLQKTVYITLQNYRSAPQLLQYNNWNNKNKGCGKKESLYCLRQQGTVFYCEVVYFCAKGSWCGCVIYTASSGELGHFEIIDSVFKIIFSVFKKANTVKKVLCNKTTTEVLNPKAYTEILFKNLVAITPWI